MAPTARDRKRAAQMLGQARSKSKTEAARRNAKLGGRPRLYPKCPDYGSHRFSPVTGKCPCGYVRQK